MEGVKMIHIFVGLRESQRENIFLMSGVKFLNHSHTLAVA